ncbi:MAG: hypothetical protein RJP95_03990 [Pirellulales bacterium]
MERSYHLISRMSGNEQLGYQMLVSTSVERNETEFRRMLRNHARIDDFGEVDHSIVEFASDNISDTNEILRSYREAAEGFRVPEDTALALVSLHVYQTEAPFTPLWLAAAAMHTKLIAKNDLAFGYFCALFDQVSLNSVDLRAGRKSALGSSEGARQRKAKNKPKTTAVLKRMAELQPAHTVKRSAELAFNEGLGSSAEANRKLWVRCKKAGTLPPMSQ